MADIIAILHLATSINLPRSKLTSHLGFTRLTTTLPYLRSAVPPRFHFGCAPMACPRPTCGTAQGRIITCLCSRQSGHGRVANFDLPMRGRARGRAPGGGGGRGGRRGGGGRAGGN